MNRFIIATVLLVSGHLLVAQNTESKNYLLTTKTSDYTLSSVSMRDEYISPLTYKGTSLGYTANTQRFLSVTNKKISLLSRWSLTAGLMTNPAETSNMFYLGTNYAYGAAYNWKLAPGLLINPGGMCDIDFGIKTIPRNINNPTNIDLATNFNFRCKAVYSWKTSRRVFRLNGTITSPLAGCMFSPYQGTSYYEIFDLGNFKNTIHFSSLHNKVGLNQLYCIDIPFRYTTWRFGFKYNFMKYKANDIYFENHEAGLVIGTTFDYIRFSGRRNTAPNNFQSTNY